MIKTITGWAAGNGKPRITPEAFWAFYALMAVITFGYHGAYNPDMRLRQTLDQTGEAVYIEEVSEFTAIEGAAGGALWPLYWSWEIALLTVDDEETAS